MVHNELIGSILKVVNDATHNEDEMIEPQWYVIAWIAPNLYLTGFCSSEIFTVGFMHRKFHE